MWNNTRLTLLLSPLPLSKSSCYHSPAASWSASFCIVLGGVPTQNHFLYGRGIPPQFISSSLPFLQFDLHCHWFLSSTPPHFFIWSNIISKGLQNFPKVPVYTGCPRRNVPDFGRVFLMLKYTDITQNTYIWSWTVTEIMAREVWNFDSCYTLFDYQIHVKTGRNMWFL